MKYVFFVLLSFLVINSSFGQETNKTIRKARPTFLSIGLASGKSTFRDFATSPLTYRSFPGSFVVSRVKGDTTRSTYFSFQYTGGLFYARHNKVVLGRSTANFFQLDFENHYKVNKWSNETWNIKAGGAFNITQSVRINGALQNNALGSEAFMNLFGSIKINRDISRIASVNKKIIGVFNYNRAPRKRSFSGQFDVGLINTNVRNGYGYIGQASVLNKSQFLDNYQFNIFSGLRFRTKLDYVIFLENGNGIKLSYTWDAMKTSKYPDKFELAIHTLSFNLMFRTK